eukprot:3005327-Pleurochrysis_carterae.AAC.1
MRAPPALLAPSCGSVRPLPPRPPLFTDRWKAAPILRLAPPGLRPSSCLCLRRRRAARPRARAGKLPPCRTPSVRAT